MSDATVETGKKFLRSLGIAFEIEFLLIPAVAATIDPELVPTIRANPIVDYIEPRVPGVRAAQDTTWNVHRVTAPQAWSRTAGSGEKVLIIDSGVDNNHADLNPDVIQACDNSDGVDRDGHGTYVAGVVAAVDNTIDIIGTSHAVRLWSSKDGDAIPDPAFTACGVEFGRINKTFAINISSGFPPHTSLTDQIKGAWNDGLIVVAIVGDGGGSVWYPASLPEVIAVTATDSQDDLMAGANSGSEVELSAPGVAVPSTQLGGGVGIVTGTSFAAPHVAAAAAMIRSYHSSWSNEVIRTSLQATAVDLGAQGWDQYYGHGLLQIDAALDFDPPDPPQQVSISGPREIQPGATCTWEAVVGAGDPPFTYSWSGEIDPPGGTDPYYTGKKDAGVIGSQFKIRVDVANLSGSDWEQITVTEDSSAPVCIM